MGYILKGEYMSDEYSLPDVKSCKVSLIRTFTLNNFIDPHLCIDSGFEFLANSESYFDYYQKNEVTIPIDGIGYLAPLKRKKKSNTYWKTFLQPMINHLNSNLLPLYMEIPVKQITADKKTLPTKIYVYLFPFGSCCVNMEVQIDGLSLGLNKLRELIGNIKTATISCEPSKCPDLSGMAFDRFSEEVIKKINDSMFIKHHVNINKTSKAIFPIKSGATHHFVFLQTSAPLLFNYNLHKLEIASIMTLEDKTILLKKKIQTIFAKRITIEEPWKTKDKPRGPDEICLFDPKCTFVYPTHIREMSSTDLKCMHSNYCSFVNVVLAVNMFLCNSLGKSNTPTSERTSEIVECFKNALFKAELNNYFASVFSSIIPIVFQRCHSIINELQR